MHPTLKEAVVSPVAVSVRRTPAPVRCGHLVPTPGERTELTQLAELRHEVGNALTPGLCYADMLLARYPV